MRRVFIGIDPGLSGAIAFIDGEFVAVYDAPSVPVKKGNDYLVADMAKLITQAASQRSCFAILEAGIAMPNQSSSSTAKAARGGGLWEGMLAMAGVPYEMVRPSAWKKVMGVTADKGEARVMAQKLFPQVADKFSRVKDDGRAEALLIAEFARRKAG
jgi:crossover junction endodeoxyribonuclease RuvC